LEIEKNYEEFTCLNGCVLVRDARRNVCVIRDVTITTSDD